MASLSLCPQFETNLMANRKVIELLLQLKSAKAHGKIYKKVKPHLFRHLLRKRLWGPTGNSFNVITIFTVPWSNQHVHEVTDENYSPRDFKIWMRATAMTAPDSCSIIFLPVTLQIPQNLLRIVFLI